MEQVPKMVKMQAKMSLNESNITFTMLLLSEETLDSGIVHPLFREFARNLWTRDTVIHIIFKIYNLFLEGINISININSHVPSRTTKSAAMPRDRIVILSPQTPFLQTSPDISKTKMDLTTKLFTTLLSHQPATSCPGLLIYFDPTFEPETDLEHDLECPADIERRHDAAY